MSIFTQLRNSKPISQIRTYIPHPIINTLIHLPNAWIANIRYQFPAKHLSSIGVTGSNGKTTTVNGIYHLLKTAKIKTGMLSTINAKIGNQKTNTGLHVTSPGPWTLQKILHSMHRQHLAIAVLEVTSHGLAQHRLLGVNFDIGIITNITHEHLDYHDTYAKYLQTKAKLLKKVKTAIINYDDQSYPQILKYLKQHNPQAKIIAYSTQRSLHPNHSNPSTDKTGKIRYIKATNIKLGKQGAKFDLLDSQKPTKIKINTPLTGKFNVSNALAVIATGIALNLNIKTIQKALATYPKISGRMETIIWKKRHIIIDFAHTPDGMEKALTTISKLKNPNKKLISVFGCAGLRDHKKRPMMGKISGKIADITILTAEDPRTEDVNQIIEEISAGCQAAGAQEHQLSTQPKTLPSTPHIFTRQPDRQQAIELAIQLSQPGDIIAILGKGHEQSMCYGTTERPWSDQKEVKKIIKS